MLDVPRELVLFVSRLLAEHRRQIGTRKGTCRLSCYRQALFPSIKERADRGAAARGVSIARYLEILIEGDEVADTYVEPDSCERHDLGMSA